jgi:hypothetical protein
MSRTKALISILMILILIALSGASVWAAPNLQESIGGEVQEIVPEVDETGTITVLVTLVDELGETERVRVSLQTAAELGLVQVDENGEPVLDDTGNAIVNEDAIGSTVEIDPGLVIEEDEEEGEEPLTEHPVASALANFFEVKLGLDYGTIMGYHEEDGMGFGVIAQACWMSYALKGDATSFREILDAKKGHTLGDLNLTAIGVPEGETPTNWGQFKKVVLGSKKAQRNLGEIMSGRAEQLDGTDSDDEGELGATSTEGKVKGKKDQAGGKPDAPPGKLKNKKDKDTGSEPPAEPPGQVKNKDKGGGKGKGKDKE